MKAKRIIAALMSLSIVCGAIPMEKNGVSVNLANAAEQASVVIASGKCGENVTWTFDDVGVLTINGTGKMDDVESPTMLPWLKYWSSIGEVVIKEGVTGIGSYAFAFCENLTSVTIPDSVKSIGKSAFQNCKKLESVTLPDGITELGKGAFSYSALTEIEIPDSVTSIDSFTFEGCKNLISITIPESVSSIDSNAFFGCSGLLSIIIKNPECKIQDNKDTISDTAIIYGFENSMAMKYAEVFDRNFVSLGEAAEIVDEGRCGESVKWSYHADGNLIISGTGPIETVLFGLPEWNDYLSDIKRIIITEGVTSIGSTAFIGCMMEEILIADSVEKIGDFAFNTCSKLAEVRLPEGLNEISIYAFSNCSSLNAVTIPESVSKIGNGVFFGCTSLTDIEVEDGNEYYVSLDGVLYTKDMKQLVDYPAGKNMEKYTIPDGVVSIGGGAFGGSVVVPDMQFPDSMTEIGVEAFSKCASIKTIVLYENVKNIAEYAFIYCSDLESVTIMNPYCKFSDVDAVIGNIYDKKTGKHIFNGTIYGYEGSTAQTYAEKYDINFVSMGEAPVPILYGDVDGDGKIAASDAAMTLAEYANLASGKETFTEKEFIACDVNEDGKIAADDAANMLAYYTYLSGNGTEKDMKKWFSSLS